MRSPAQCLISSTWLAEDPLFANHDEFNPIDWEQVAEVDFDKPQQVLVNVLSYLTSFGCGPDLLSIDVLNEHERSSVLEALKVKWAGITLEENL